LKTSSGTHHSGDTRTATPFATEATTISEIDGNLSARFLRTNLTASGINGSIDIRNDYGDTSLTLDDTLDTQRAHRILSESGAIALL
jgi:hypothetical protein